MPAPPFRRVAIVGVGLIGGSLGLAVRRRWRGVRVVGIDRAAVLRRALKRGAVHEGTTSLAAGLRGCDLIVLALPVDGIIGILPRLRRLADKGAIVTDVGSTKVEILAAAARHGLRGRFVGGHPMAGSERSGVENADAGLFDDAPWVLCPLGGTPVAGVRRLASGVGARPVSLPARQHDELMAGISHLPQLLSVALVNAAVAGRGRRHLGLAGPGFRQMARLAASSPRLWDGILRTNAPAVRRAMRRLAGELRILERSLETGCAPRFRRAARLRAASYRRPGGGVELGGDRRRTVRRRGRRGAGGGA